MEYEVLVFAWFMITYMVYRKYLHGYAEDEDDDKDRLQKCIDHISIVFGSLSYLLIICLIGVYLKKYKNDLPGLLENYLKILLFIFIIEAIAIYNRCYFLLYPVFVISLGYWIILWICALIGKAIKNIYKNNNIELQSQENINPIQSVLTIPLNNDLPPSYEQYNIIKSNLSDKPPEYCFQHLGSSVSIK